MMITLTFLIMTTTALSTSSVGYVRSREMLRENTGNEFFDSIEDAAADIKTSFSVAWRDRSSIQDERSSHWRGEFCGERRY